MIPSGINALSDELARQWDRVLWARNKRGRYYDTPFKASEQEWKAYADWVDSNPYLGPMETTYEAQVQAGLDREIKEGWRRAGLHWRDRVARFFRAARPDAGQG